MNLVKMCNDDTFKYIVSTSKNISEISKRIGYKHLCESASRLIKERIKQLNISDKHLKRHSLKEQLQNKKEFSVIDLSLYKTCKKSGRDVIYLPSHPRSHSDGTVYVHIVQAENKLKRFLKTEEVVHHVDFDKNNNNIDNLWIFATNSEHVNYHTALRYNQKYQLYVEDGIYHCFLINPQSIICPICGGLKTKKGKMCNICRAKDNLYKIPCKDILLSTLITNNWILTKTAKVFNVTDNTVRKWCKKYDIDFKNHNYKHNHTES